jgi:hypothetical protein
MVKVLEVTRIERRAVVELTNGWLSGFINADGGFSARIRKIITKQNGTSIYSKIQFNSSK